MRPAAALAALAALAVRRPLAVVILVVVLAGAGAGLGAGLRPSTAADTLVGRSSASYQATVRYQRLFGDDAVIVLVREPLQSLVLTEDIGRLLGLEGCLSGNVPAGVVPRGGPGGPCAQIGREHSTQLVFGPATFINESAAELDDQLAAEQAAERTREQQASGAAYRVARARHVPARAAAAYAAQAVALVRIQFIRTLLPLAQQYNLLTPPSLDDPDFVRALVFDPTQPLGTPKARFSSLFPARDAAIVQVRLRAGLPEPVRARAIALIRRAVAMPDWRLGQGGRYAVTGVPVIAGDLGNAVTRALRLLLAASILVMAATLGLVFRGRPRLLPLGLALAAAGLTFGGLAVSGAPLTMASVGVLPVLIGLAVDYAIQFQSRYDEVRRAEGLTAPAAAVRAVGLGGPTIAAAAAATAGGFLVLGLPVIGSPVPMVAGFGLLLVFGVAAAVVVALAAGSAALVLAAGRRGRGGGSAGGIGGVGGGAASGGKSAGGLGGAVASGAGSAGVGGRTAGVIAAAWRRLAPSVRGAGELLAANQPARWLGRLGRGGAAGGGRGGLGRRADGGRGGSGRPVGGGLGRLAGGGRGGSGRPAGGGLGRLAGGGRGGSGRPVGGGLGRRAGGGRGGSGRPAGGGGGGSDRPAAGGGGGLGRLPAGGRAGPGRLAAAAPGRLAAAAPGRLAAGSRGRVERAGAAVLAAAAVRPGRVLGLAAALAVLGFGLGTQTPVESDLQKLVPQSLPALRDLAVLQRATHVGGEIDVLVSADDLTRPAVVAWMTGYQQRIEQRFGYTGTRGCGRAVLCPAFSLPDLFQTVGSRPTATDIRDLLAAVPPYFSREVITADHRSATLAFGIRLMPLAQQKRVIDAMRAGLRPPPGVRAELVGLPVLAADANARIASPWARALTLLASLLAVGLVLAAALRSWRRAVIPLVPIVLASGWSAFVLYATRIPLNPMSVTLGALVVAIATEFSVLLAERYRQERAAGFDPTAALERTYRSTGVAVLASGATAVAGFAVLAVSDIRMLRDFGLVTVVDLTVALLGVMVVLPCVLHMAERRPARLPRAPAAAGAPAPQGHPPTARAPGPA